MIDNFPQFARMVADDLQQFLQGEVFVVDIGKVATGVIAPDGSEVMESELVHTYLKSFPEGTNPLFITRTEHDCSCCKQFLRRAGHVVIIKNDEIKTVWDNAANAKELGHYKTVAVALRDFVRSKLVNDLFRIGMKETSFGSQATISQDKKSGNALTWKHFFTGAIPDRLRCEQPDTIRGEYRTNVDVFRRSLKEVAPDAVEAVLDLINANDLYKGAENRAAIEDFQKAQKAYAKLRTVNDRCAYEWTRAHGPKMAIRAGSSIGGLLYDLSPKRDAAGEETPGLDLEKAVAIFEKKVAPENYKRSASPITEAMVKKATAEIENLGLGSALERRLAKIDDMSVRDVLWVDAADRKLMKGGLHSLTDSLISHAVKSTASKGKYAEEAEHAESIAVEDFLKLLPTASSIEMLFRNSHISNLVAVTAPVHEKNNQLFKWDNDFAWSYTGSIADSALRQAVQARGGRVDGVFRFSHSWNHPGMRNASLMDLHVFMPGWRRNTGTPSERHYVGEAYGSGRRVGWNQRQDALSGGRQDVDYTGAAAEGYVPVENTTFPDLARMPEGVYQLKIHNWQFRSPTTGGFHAEIEFAGQVHSYVYEKPLGNKEWVDVATVTLKNGVFTIEHHLKSSSASQEKWGINTEAYAKVSAVTLSPNYWGDNAVGNKHLFFLLEGCKPDESVRGIYNEFLSPRLEKHRKVFEVIGAKTQCAPTADALCGLGFSSTKKASVVVRMFTGKKRRLLSVEFGNASPSKGEDVDQVAEEGVR